MTTPSTSQAVIVTRTFRARPERVFAAFENPEEMAGWMAQPGAKTEVRSLEVREGGAIQVRMTWDNGMSIDLQGAFTRVDKPSLLEFTWGMEGDESNSGVVTVTFASSDGGTELTLTHTGLTGPALEYSEAGWNAWFDSMQTLLEVESDRTGAK